MAKKIPQPTTDLPATAEQAFAQDQANAAVVAAAEHMAQDKLEMNRLLGRIEATQAISSFIETVSLAQIAKIKEEKSYRALKDQVMLIDGVEVRLDTWEGFCKALGSSRENMDLQLGNLRALGESALARAQELGMTTRDLRKLRQLDASDQKVVIGELEAAVGDKDAIIDLITDMSARHVKEKEAMQKELDEQRAEAKATARILADKDERIKTLQKQIVRQENRTMDEKQEDDLHALDLAVVEFLKPRAALEDAIAACLAYEDNAMHLHAANALHELKEAIVQIQIRFALGDVTNPDDSWMNVTDEEAEQRHDNVQCALRDEEEWEENVKLHGQPGLHMQTSLNSGRNKEAGQRGVYPEEDALAKQHVRDFGRGQGRQRFVGADGGEQVQGFRQDEVVVVILHNLEAVDAVAVAKAVVQIEGIMGMIAADMHPPHVADVLPRQAVDAAVAVVKMQAVAIGGAQQERHGGSEGAVFPHDDENPGQAEHDAAGNQEETEPAREKGRWWRVPFFQQIREKIQGEEYQYQQKHQQQPIGEVVTAVALFIPAVFKPRRHDDGLLRRHGAAQIRPRRGDDVNVIVVFQQAAAVADRHALPWFQQQAALHTALIAHIGKRRPAPLMADAAKGAVQGDAARIADDARPGQELRAVIGEAAQVEERSATKPQRQQPFCDRRKKRPGAFVVQKEQHQHVDDQPDGEVRGIKTGAAPAVRARVGEVEREMAAGARCGRHDCGYLKPSRSSTVRLKTGLSAVLSGSTA